MILRAKIRHWAVFNLALVLVSTSAIGVIAGEWITSAGAGCKVWNPNPTAGEIANWSGACKDGLADGKGTVNWLRNDKTYERDEGQWSAGRQGGVGSQSWPGGEYKGQLTDGLPQGHGVLLLGESRYEGAFVGGRPNGSGVLKNASGIFDGQWREGCFNDGKRRATIGISIQACQ